MAEIQPSQSTRSWMQGWIATGARTNPQPRNAVCEIPGQTRLFGTRKTCIQHQKKSNVTWKNPLSILVPKQHLPRPGCGAPRQVQENRKKESSSRANFKQRVLMDASRRSEDLWSSHRKRNIGSKKKIRGRVQHKHRILELLAPASAHILVMA
jgi:hypothetical protein